jgi:hypothetical protein
MIACICGGPIDILAFLGISAALGWICKKIKQGFNCCCSCHKNKD